MAVMISDILERRTSRKHLPPSGTLLTEEVDGAYVALITWLYSTQRINRSTTKCAIHVLAAGGWGVVTVEAAACSAVPSIFGDNIRVRVGRSASVDIVLTKKQREAEQEGEEGKDEHCMKEGAGGSRERCCFTFALNGGSYKLCHFDNRVDTSTRLAVQAQTQELTASI